MTSLQPDLTPAGGDTHEVQARQTSSVLRKGGSEKSARLWQNEALFGARRCPALSMSAGGARRMARWVLALPLTGENPPPASYRRP